MIISKQFFPKALLHLRSILSLEIHLLQATKMTDEHYFQLIVIIICIVPFSTQALEIDKPYYEIVSLKDHVGLYYNKLSNAKVSNSEYTLLTYINLTIASQKYDHLTQIFARSLNICAHGTKETAYHRNSNFCQNSLQSFQSRISAIKDKIENIKYLTENELNKKGKIIKRGLFNGASYVSHWLFGTPDVEDAKFYKNAIDSVIFDNRNTHLLMKKQIAIISNTIQNFNSSIHNLQADEDKFNDNIRLINSFSNSTTNYLNDIFTRHLILEQLFSLSQIYSELDENYNLIISSITLARHNILNQQIVSPLNLLSEMSKIILQNGLKWPIPLTHYNIHKYDKLYKLEVNYIDNVIIFAIRIPLAEEMPYELYEMLPFPVRNNSTNTYSYIQPRFPYILLSTTKVYYALLEDLEVCLPADTNERICSIKYVTRTTGQPTCETTIITSTYKTVPSSCLIHTIEADFETWYYIGNNKWTYIFTRPSQLTLTCSPTHIEDVELTAVGIILLEPQCKGYTEAIVLEPSRGVTANLNNNLTISKTIDDDCCPKNYNLTVESVITLYVIDGSGKKAKGSQKFRETRVGQT